VYRSERDTGHRNRAIAHLLRAFGIVDGDPELGLDLYFRQCAVSVDCRELAMIGATLANGGVHPRTAEVAVGGAVVREVLSVMASCGMYDGAGAWMTGIGLPAKSGVSGGILAVLPGRLAIACYSPPLDERGNSVRGVAVCRDLSERIGLHLVRPAERPPAPVRSAVDLSRISSKRVRPLQERVALDALAEAAIVIEVQGELGFGAVEALSRLIEPSAPRLRAAVVDVGRVSRVEAGGSSLLLGLQATLARAGIELVVSGDPATPVKSALSELIHFATLDRALESVEDDFLREAGLAQSQASLKADEHDFLAGLDDLDRARLIRLLEARTYPEHAIVVDRGGPADELFLVVKGRLSVIDSSGAGPPRRAATVRPGGSFGEIGLALGGARTATVQADTDVELLVLGRPALDELQKRHPRLYGTILEQLLVTLARTAARLDREVAALVEG
jgi:glutaminase